MKQINVKLLAILLLSTLTILVGSFFLYRFQKQRNAEGLLTRAQAKAEAEEYGEAAGFLRRYLAIRPDDNEQLAQLALTLQKHVRALLKTGNQDGRTLQMAYATTEEAVRKNPDNLELRREAVDFAMMYRRFEDAIMHINALMESGDDDPKLKVMLAQCYTLSGQDSEKAVPALSEMIGFDRADRTFSAERATAPDVLEAYMLLAQVFYLNLRDLDSALPIIDRLTEVNPDEYQAHLMRASFYGMLGNPDYKEVIADETLRALELAPDEQSTLLAAGNLYLLEKDYDRAQELYEECLKKHPGNAGAYQGLSTLALTQRDMDAALAYLNEGIELNQENNAELTSLLWDRANVEIETQQIEAAQATMEELRGLNYQRPFLDFLEGRIEFAKQNWLTASQRMSEARGFIAQARPRWLAPLDSSLAVCYEKMGQNDLRLKAMQRISDADPLNVGARWGVMEAYLAMGQADKAVTEYDIIEDQIDDSPLGSNVGLYSARLQLELLQQERQLEALRNYNEAGELVKKIQENGLLKQPAIADLVKRYYTLTKDEAKAQAVADFVRTTRPNDPNLLLQRIQKTALTKGIEAAIDQLDTNSRRLGEPIGIRLLRCELLARVRPRRPSSNCGFSRRTWAAFRRSNASR